MSAAGIPNLITADMIKDGAAVIDVRINKAQDAITAKPKYVVDMGLKASGRKPVTSLQSQGVLVP